MEDDGDDKDDSKRRTRNLSEKKRRDQFNILINELCTLVTTNNRKMDKSTVLKSTISYLKTHNETTVRSRAYDIQDDWKPKFLSNEEFTYLVLEALEGFVLAFSTTGHIYYVSESISFLLGHNPADIVNKSVFDLVFEEDQQSLYGLLQGSRNITKSVQIGKEDEINFRCHMRRGNLDFAEEVTYELIQFNGHFRSNGDLLHKENINYPRGKENRSVFVCTGRLSNPQLIRDVSLVDSSRSEFTSRHSLEWKFLFLDHRAPPIIGYLPFEVLGTSGYDYYHFDDLEKITSCHEALMQKGELTSCYYRFLTKGQQWIWLQTRYYITYHQWNSKPEFVVCNHRVVSYADMEKDMKQVDTGLEVMNEVALNRGTVEEAPARPAENAIVTDASPSYVSEASETIINSYPPLSQPASVKSTSAGSTTGTVSTVQTVATASVSWPQPSQPVYPESETASASGESRSTQKNNEHDTYKGSEPVLVPQHGIGAQYLEPAPFIGTVAVSLPSLPIFVSPDQAQLQEQLQKKHQELQQMIVRQQEELRIVKEQLLLARLGILQPIINENPTQNPHVNIEEVQETPQLPAPPQDYDRTTGPGNSGYQQQRPPNPDRDNLPQ